MALQKPNSSSCFWNLFFLFGSVKSDSLKRWRKAQKFGWLMATMVCWDEYHKPMNTKVQNPNNNRRRRIRRRRNREKKSNLARTEHSLCTIQRYILLIFFGCDGNAFGAKTKHHHWNKAECELDSPNQVERQGTTERESERTRTNKIENVKALSLNVSSNCFAFGFEMFCWFCKSRKEKNSTRNLSRV